MLTVVKSNITFLRTIMDLVNVIDHPINQIIKLSFIILTLNKVLKTKNLENIDYIPTTVTCLSYIHFQIMSIAPLTNIDCVLERSGSHNSVIERSDVKGRKEGRND